MKVRMLPVGLMTTDPAVRLGLAVYVEQFGVEPPPSTREELEARIEPLDAVSYAAIRAALDRVAYEEFARAARGAAS